MSAASVTVRPAVARAFLSEEMHDHGTIDLQGLAELAKKAIGGSEVSLGAALAIAEGGFVTRFLHSGDMQRHVIQSITHIRDISKVNLGLSAICNDLALANLEHARRIESNHNTTSQRLREVKQLTTDLLEHLRKPQRPPLLESLGPVITALNVKDRNSLSASLQVLSAGIDKQYAAIQSEVDELKRAHVDQLALVKQAEQCAGSLTASMDRKKAETFLRVGKLTSRIDELNESLSGKITAIGEQMERMVAAAKLQSAEATAAQKKQDKARLGQREAVEQRFQALATQLIGFESAAMAREKTISKELARVESAALAKVKGVTDELAIQKLNVTDAADTQRKVNQAYFRGLVKQDQSVRHKMAALHKKAMDRIVMVAILLGALNVAGFVHLGLKGGLWR